MRAKSSCSLTVLALVSFLFVTGMGHSVDVHLQSIPEASSEYDIYSNGIVAVHNERVEIYLKPVNDVFLKSTGWLLDLLPVGTTKSEDPHDFTDWTYYGEALEQKRRPEVFVVEVMFITSDAGLAFDPYDNVVILGEQRAPLLKYAVVDTSQPSNTRGRHSRPHKRGHTTFFCGGVVQLPHSGPLLAGQSPYDSVCAEQAQVLLHPSTEPKEFALPSTLGFILVFDCPTPVPGADIFTVQLHGLRSHGAPVMQYDFLFNRSHQNQVDRF